MYVSSRDSGTRPLRTLNPKAFHKIVWDSTDVGRKERLVEERSIGSNNPASRSDTDNERQDARSSDSGLILNEYTDVLIHRIRACRQKLAFFSQKTANGEQETVSYPDHLVDSYLQQDEHAREHSISHGKIPNAIFARKFRKIKSSNLPLTIRERPIAEDKAINMAVDRSSNGVRKFRGPFTPQLWFDSGLDFKWKKC